MLYSLPCRKSSVLTAASFFLASSFPALSAFSQSGEEPVAVFILKGNTKYVSGKSIEGVDLELTKDGKTINKITSGKNGKYYIQMGVSTNNKSNDYLLNISFPGTIPKLLSINAYMPPDEYKQNPGARYEFSLEIIMTETSVKDIILEKPSGKIHWDSEQDKFAFDQVYAKIAQKENDKLKDENYLRELAEKKRKEEEEAAKKKADEEARLKADADAKAKADEEARRLADQKAKDEADRIFKENMEAMKQAMKKKRMQDSLDSLAALNAAKTNVEIKKMSRPVSPDDVDQNAFDGAGAYSINIAKKAIKAQQERLNREKAKNLSAKYETNNTLTSLLDEVDEHDKKMKKQ